MEQKDMEQKDIDEKYRELDRKLHDAVYMNWISVDDRLPEEGEYIIKLEKHGQWEKGFFKDGKFFDEEGYQSFPITHWFKPKPPKEGK